MSRRGAYQKKAKNTANIYARHDFLIAGINAPHSIDKSIQAELAGQRAFAALNIPKLKITPIALNTLKNLSNEIFTDTDENGNRGFSYINALRIRLFQSISKATTTRTVDAKAKRMEDTTGHLRALLTATEAQSLKRQKAYLSLYATINNLIKDGDLQAEARERLYRALENHHAAFADLFEPEINIPTDAEFKVTVLRELKNKK